MPYWVSAAPDLLQCEHAHALLAPLPQESPLPPSLDFPHYVSAAPD